MTPKAPGILGKGQFSIFLPRKVDSEYYVKSPVKVKAEMFLYPKQLGIGGLHLKSIPCSAKVQKLTEDNNFDIVNVPIKIEAEVLLSPGFNYSSKTSTPQSKFDLFEGYIHILIEGFKMCGSQSYCSDHHKHKILTDYGEEMEPKCLVKVIEPDQQLESEGVEGLQFLRKNQKDALNNLNRSHCVKSTKAKEVLVEELKLDENPQKVKNLTRQLHSYQNQVSEQNKRIQNLQNQLREQEPKTASSIERVQIVEQQCKTLDQKLKATECRAKNAEHRAENIKQRTKILSVACRHQGIQLKYLTKHIALFAGNLGAQKVQAICVKKMMQHQVRDPQDTSNASDTTTSTSALVEDSDMYNTKMRSKQFPDQNLFHEIETNGRENSPDLNSPSTKSFYQTITMQELNDKYVLFLCKRSPKDQLSHKLDLEKERLETTLLECKDLDSTSESLLFPTETGELLLNQCQLEMAPDWPLEFESSMQRAEELVKKCSVQAVKLKDLSKDLDCFPQKPTRGDQSSSSHVSSANNSPSNLKGKVRSAGEDGPKSLQAAPLDDLQGDNLVLCTNVTHQTNRCQERYPLNLAKAREPLVHKQTKMDAWMQTHPLPPKIELELNNKSTLQHSSTHCQLFSKSWFPYRYEVKAWRIASQILIQGLLLWLGLLFLPQLSLFQYSPPPT